MRLRRFGLLNRNGRALTILLVLLVAAGATALMGAATVDARFMRDVSRIVYNDNLELLEDMRRHAGATDDSLLALLDSPEAPTPNTAIIISIADNKLWYRVGDSVVFETRVATGSGKVLEKGPDGSRWKFETPRGRLKVLSKDEDRPASRASCPRPITHWSTRPLSSDLYESRPWSHIQLLLMASFSRGR